MKEYVPIFFDWVEVTGELNAQEKGRLIDAIVLYAQGGDWQEQIKGNERYLFPAFKKQIDRANDISEVRSRATESRRNQTTSNDIKLHQTESNDIKTANNKENNNNNKEDNKNKNDKKNMCADALNTRFESFWSSYPRHTAKQNALKAFAKLNPDDDLLSVMLQAIERQKKSSQWQGGEQFIPHPATWLNGKRWEDDIVTERQKPAPAARVVSGQDYQQRDYSGKKAEMPDWMIQGMKELENVEV